MTTREKILMITIMLTTILLIIPMFASAYNTNDLIHYYNFDSGNVNKSIDMKGTKNITTDNRGNYGMIRKQGLQENMTFWNSTTSFPLFSYYNGTIGSIGKSFTINLWLYSTGNYYTQSFPFAIETNGNSSTYMIYGFVNVNGSICISNASVLTIAQVCPLTSEYKGLNSIGWHMISIVYDNVTGYVSLYTDSYLIQTPMRMNNQMITQNLQIGASSLVDRGIDEFSIWNNSLTTLDINYLYNNGNGLNYNQTISATSTNTTPICINDNTYCTNPYYVNGNLSCYYSDTLHCSQGCSNQTGTAICSNTVNNTCNIIGSKQCISSTIIGTCDVQGDGSYGYIPTTCQTGQYCQASGNFFATCNSVPQQGIINETTFNVIPYIASGNETFYDTQSNPNAIIVTTTNTAHEQDFYTIADVSSYTSRTCNYKEEVKNTYTTPTQYVNDTNITLTTTNQDSYLNIVFIPQENNGNNTYISIKSQLGITNTGYNITRNVTAKSVCINQYNGSVIYCDYSTNTYDDLQDVNMTINYDFTSSTYSEKIIFDRASDNIIYTSPKTFSGADNSNIEIKTDNMTINSYTYNTYTTPNGYYQTIPNDKTFIPCTYINTGCYIIRTYNDVYGYPSYLYTIDKQVCINKLGATTSDIAIGQQGQQSQGQRLWITLLIMAGIFVIFLIIGMTLNATKIFTIVGIVVDVFILICASIPSFPFIGGSVNPAYVVMMGIISVALAIFISIRPSQNNGG